MRLSMAVAAILFASTSFGLAQSKDASCGDVINDASATCPTVLAPAAGGSINSGAGGVNGSSGSIVGTPGSAIDKNTTNAVNGSSAPTPKGMAPLDVPNDPLNGNTRAPAGSNNATGNRNPSVPFSNGGVSTGGSAISSPSIGN